MAPLVRLEGIDKSFGAVRALDGAVFEAAAGEIHALVGENGSGKTTLMRVLAGDLRPDGGRLVLDGEARAWRTPAEARDAGVGLVFQEPNLAPDLTVAENLVLGRLPSRLGRVDWRAVGRRFDEIAADTGIRLSPRRRVRDLSPDQRQLIEVAKVAATRPRVIALDEPTASLTDDEVETLFGLLRRRRDEGAAVIFISHRLKEVSRLCDRVTILRDGKTRGTLDVARTDDDEIVRLMVGRELGTVQRHRTPPGAPVLAVRGLTRGDVLRDISLDVRAGEIVGIAGLVGAGRSALIRTLFGLREADAGEVRLAGERAVIRRPRDAIGLGMAVVPEDRRHAGLVPDMSVAENIALGEYARKGLIGAVDGSENRRRAERFIDSLGIRTRGPQARVRTLSGGNQQKVVIARWLARDPRLLILDEPTRGIDVGAKAEIYGLLDDLAARGVAVLVSSSELPELLTLCDRIYALYRGTIVGHVAASEATEEGLARAISGIERELPRAG